MTTITKPIHFARKGHRKAAVAGPPPQPEPADSAARVQRVSKMMALAIRFDQLLRDGVVADQSELARLAHVTQPRMTQIMNLLHLAPHIQEALLDLPTVNGGRDPITEHHLRRITRLSHWADQQKIWDNLINGGRPHFCSSSSFVPTSGVSLSSDSSVENGNSPGYSRPNHPLS